MSPATTAVQSHSESAIFDWIDRSVTWARQYDLYFFSAALALLSFSAPGRDGPNSAGGLDVIALAKFGIRVAACGYFGFLLMWAIRIRDKPLRTSPLFVPWFVFAFWSLLSVTWSALPTVSFGQWLGLVALLAFSHTLATRQAVRSMDWLKIVRWLHWILFAYCAAVMTVHVLSPGTSGLDRALWIAGSNGLVHPTAAGATSSLGVVIGVFLIARKLTRHPWLMVAMVLVELSLLYCSKSRSALLMTVVCFLVYAAFLTSTRVRGVSLLTIGGMLLTLVAIDSGFEWVGLGMDEVANYLSRGQTADDLKNASGRSEMWAAIWEQIQSSPVWGHGYFVTSSNGLLDVWQGPSNQDAHNVMLQVWVTTGLIGVMPFVWAMWRAFRCVARERNTDFFWFIVLLALWYAGWGQGCVTFLGPIRPESVVFFTGLGLLAGRRSETDHRVSGDTFKTATS